MKYKQVSPQYRECKCGCGRPGAAAYDKGVFKGYRVFARECIDAGRHGAWSEERKAKLSNTIAGMRHPLAKPMGSIREGRMNKDGKLYRWIKVAATGRWQIEHRYVVEQHLGTKLSPTQHIHHINGDGLDNRIENLVILSNSEHARQTCKDHGNNLLRKNRKPHKCPLCGILHEYPLLTSHLTPPEAVLEPLQQESPPQSLS